MEHAQITDTILMIRPAHFGFNVQTAGNNAFQRNDHKLKAREMQAKAQQEFDAFVLKLREAGIQVIVVEDTPSPVKHDAVFPNNWFSTHQDGTLITYPMFSPMRRLERREDVVSRLFSKYQVCKIVRLEQREELERYLEGTGSMILDRSHRVVYACRSIRTDEGLLDEFALWMGYEKIIFEAYDKTGIPIYHTNVMMALGETFAVICLEAVTDAVQRRVLTDKLAATNKEIVAITHQQMTSFAGNMIQLLAQSGERILVMSTRAYESLTEEQIAQLGRHTQLLHSPLDTIETYGGGSARCMIAEIFLPRR
ncbi:MAG: amidinotransferase [Bacteroidetes bacterium]|nr:MAG: amidinotransferase [Bacteroidota bacterium]